MRCWQAGIVVGIVVGRLFHDRAASTWLSSGAENTQNRHDTDPSGSITRQAICCQAFLLWSIIHSFAPIYATRSGKKRIFLLHPPSRDTGKNAPTLWRTLKPPLRLMDLSYYDLDFDRTRMHPGRVTDPSGHTHPSLTHTVDVKSPRSTKCPCELCTCDVWPIWGALDCNWCCMNKVELKCRP